MGDDSPQTRHRSSRTSHQSSISSIASRGSKLNRNVSIDIQPEPETHSLKDVKDDEDKTSLYLKEKNKIPGSFTLISVTILITVTLLFVKYMEGRLPKSLTEDDLIDNPKSFIEERSRQDLHTLTKELIPRISGSFDNDILIVNRFLEILTKIKENRSTPYNIEFEEHRPSGTFFYDDDEGYTSSYLEIANVIAKLEPSDPSLRTNHSILLNCHFDTKPGCLGASDNMISCSVMLEILRVLSTQPELVLRNNVIFLFNGAEEFGLSGAHGFVRGKISSEDTNYGHKWSSSVKAFFNLEGAGAGGKEILFQVDGGYTDETGWLIKAYNSVPSPYGTVLGEEAFQFGLIPSDTDFRVLRDFGKLPGLDIAFIKNGWVYHTKYDTLSEIPPGSIQHMGENALALVEHLGNVDFSKEHKSSREMVYFDVLGIFMISYSKTVGIIINLLVAIISIGVIVFHVGWKPKDILKYVWFLISTILAWGLAIGSASLVAVILNTAGNPKPFYSYPSLALILFGIPTVLTHILVYSFSLRGSPKDTWLAGKFTLAFVLFVSTFIARASYVFVPPLIFGIVGWSGARYLMRGWPKSIMITYILIGELIPLIMSSYIITVLSDVLVPTLGRSGSETNANLFFGIIVAGLTLLAFSGLSSLFVNYDKKILISLLLISIFLLNPMIVFGLVGKIPYQQKTPMRLTISDMDRIWYDSSGTEVKSESGYFFYTLDSNTGDFFPEFAKTVKEIESVVDVELDYENCEDLYCTQSFIWPTTQIIKKTHWIPKSSGLPLSLRSQMNITVTEHPTGSPDLRNISLDFWGPSQTTVVLSHKRNFDALVNIQVLGENLPILEPGSIRWRGRDVYYIYHGRGYRNVPFKVNILLTRNSGDDDGGHIIDIVHSGLFMHGDDRISDDYQDFLDRFPSWAFTGMSWSTVTKIYQV